MKRTNILDTYGKLLKSFDQIIPINTNEIVEIDKKLYIVVRKRWVIDMGLLELYAELI